MYYRERYGDDVGDFFNQHEPSPDRSFVIYGNASVGGSPVLSVEKISEVIILFVFLILPSDVTAVDVLWICRWVLSTAATTSVSK